MENKGQIKEDIIKAKLNIYKEYLKEYNSHTNITAIRDDSEIEDKHFADSALLQKYIGTHVSHAIDIGTGAGFPGMVLAIYNPHISFTLMDSIAKKTKFLGQIKEKLSLSNVDIVTSRAEDYIDATNRESYDLGLCRGVAKLNIILEYVMPFLKVGGTFLAQKIDDSEISLCDNALDELGGKITNIYRKKLPISGDMRYIIEIKKIKHTPDKYPRRSGIPTKKPL